MDIATVIEEMDSDLRKQNFIKPLTSVDSTHKQINTADSKS